MTPPLSCACHAVAREGVVDGGEVVIASVKVEGGDLDPMWIASQTPLLNHLPSWSTILKFWEFTLCLLYPIWWSTGDEIMKCSLRLCLRFEGSFRFADVTGFTQVHSRATFEAKSDVPQPTSSKVNRPLLGS